MDPLLYAYDNSGDSDSEDCDAVEVPKVPDKKLSYDSIARAGYNSAAGLTNEINEMKRYWIESH